MLKTYIPLLQQCVFIGYFYIRTFLQSRCLGCEVTCYLVVCEGKHVLYSVFLPSFLRNTDSLSGCKIVGSTQLGRFGPIRHAQSLTGMVGKRFWRRGNISGACMSVCISTWYMIRHSTSKKKTRKRKEPSINKLTMRPDDFWTSTRTEATTTTTIMTVTTNFIVDAVVDDEQQQTNSSSQTKERKALLFFILDRVDPNKKTNNNIHTLPGKDNGKLGIHPSVPTAQRYLL